MDWANIAGIAVQTVAIVLSLGAFVMRLHLDLRLWIQQSQSIAAEVVQIKTKMEKMTEIITQLAIQDTRINMTEARVQNLEDRLSHHIRNES